MQKTILILGVLVGTVVSEPYFFMCKQRRVYRGDGQIKATCPEGTQNIDNLCYYPCRQQWTEHGTQCWLNCPDGYTLTTDNKCQKGNSYGRG